MQPKRNTLYGRLAEMTITSYRSDAMEGRQIKAARALLGWSQTDLCRESGISRATLNDLENDTGDPRRSSTTRVETAFSKHGVVFLANGDIQTGGVGVRLKS